MRDAGTASAEGDWGGVCSPPCLAVERSGLGARACTAEWTSERVRLSEPVCGCVWVIVCAQAAGACTVCVRGCGLFIVALLTTRAINSEDGG